MTFQHFIDAVRSAWGVADSVTIVVAVLAACGINLVLPDVPGPAAVFACLLSYLVGFLVSCYKAAEHSLEQDVLRGKVASLTEEKLALQKQLTLANDYWKSRIARTHADISIKNAELEHEKSSHKSEIAAINDVLAAKDAEIEQLKSPVEVTRRAISVLPANELAMVGTLQKGPLKTSGFGGILSHLASLGIVEKLKVPGVFTPTWGLTSVAMNALCEDEGLSASAADAAKGGVRDLEAEKYVSSRIRRLLPQQLAAVFVMYDRGFFDYHAVDGNSWDYESDRGANDLKELESIGIARYETLGNGMRRWTLTDHATKAISDNPALISEGRTYFESVIRGDGL